MISPRKSITLKISLLVLGATCLVLALIVERMFVNSRDLIREEAEQTGRNLVTALANQVEQDFLVVAKAADHLAAFLETGTFSEEQLLSHIKRTVIQTPEVYGSAVAFLPFAFKPDVKLYAPYFFRTNGGVKFEQLATESYNYPEKDWFRIPVETGKPTWVEPYFDEGGGNVAMTTYARPMFEQANGGPPAKLKAVVTADISLESLNKLVNSKRVYDTGFLAVFSPKGTFVTNRYPDRVMRDTIFDLADDRKFPGSKEIARRVISEESGFYDVGPGITGVDSYLAFSRMDPPGWTLAAMLPKAELYAKVDALRQETRILATVGLVLLVIAAALVARSISRPLRKMASESAKVAEGNLDIDLTSIKSADEVGQLARAFTRMTEGLKERERIKDTFGRYLTQEVVKRLLESKDGLKLGGEIREISIMMSDLRGFTALSSSMTPEQVIKFLNRYLGMMVEIILDHRGIIDEIIGDGILAFFGAPEHVENHPELAVACALKMQNAMKEVNALNEADGLPHLEMGIAVNTGEVVVGNIGSEKRAKYGAVGAQVNFTGRVEGFTVGGQVLVSNGAYEKLADQLEVGNVLTVEMKGVPGKVRLYDVKGIRGQYETRIEDREEALTRLETGLSVRVYAMDQKILESAGKPGTITHASLKSGQLVLKDEIAQWDDVRIVVNSTDPEFEGSEIYGKVISLKHADDKFEALVRFTSVSPGGYKLLRQLLASGHRAR